MRLSFKDTSEGFDAAISKSVKRLSKYRDEIEAVIETADSTCPEYSLVHATVPEVQRVLDEVAKKFKGIKHVVLIGIGGSSLGVEAIHSVLSDGTVKLTVLDTLSAVETEAVIEEISKTKKIKDLAICVISKSGGTTETIVNASVVLSAVEKKFGKAIYAQTLFVGNEGTDFMKYGKKTGCTTVAMPEGIGGRYSVATEVGLVPLTLLGYDVDSFVDGVFAASAPEIEEATAQSAARIYQYIQKGYAHYNFFAFEKRLSTLGAWYRQLFAESTGKAVDKAGKPVKKGMLPTISTPVELHSVGQLYLSGFAGVYTDFVTFDDEAHDFAIPKTGLAKAYGRFSVQEVTTAIYGGVIGAYNEKKLPYRTTIFEDDMAYELGLFMGMRMREVMYIASLMNVDAFDQPNVELYKQKTKAILGL